MKNLQDKTAFVTGGSRGIGAAIVSALAQQGANVAFTYQNTVDKAQALVNQIEQNGGKAFAIQADSADPQAVISAVDQTAKTFGKVDILVNNAGVAYYNDISAFTLQEFDHIMAVNVRAVFAATQAALKHMPDGGRIITIGSCLATRKNITVNIVHPGPVNTDMNPADGEYADHQRAKLAVQKYGEGEDIAGIVTYLASPQAWYITGAGFDVDGGTNI
jgi:3-oxoacyl-[acyl-carrier protein] reductase